MKKPNVIFVFADQWRQQATGFAGNPTVKTPVLDALAKESVHFTHAVSECPVCCPYRASLLTGQRPLTHGVFMNDVYLEHKSPSIADAFTKAEYDTAYIGKWHVDGHGRSKYIPPERRQGFDYWNVLECTHDYNRSPYYSGNCDEQKLWEGYDAAAQTRCAENYIRSRNDERPFFMVLSWGPPHEPYETAPEEFRQMYRPEQIALRPNVPETMEKEAREWLHGYYAHCSALDTCLGSLLKTIDECAMTDDTILVFTSDHGDMLGSQDETKKQRPWDESIRVPFLLRYPNLPDWTPRETPAPISAADIMPTLLGLCDIDIPNSVEGLDFSEHISGGDDPAGGSVLLTCPHPFGQWNRYDHNGKEFRGLRTQRYTYVRDLNGPWLLYDNEQDPYQLNNLINQTDCSELQQQLDRQLKQKLQEQNDAFLHGLDYVRQWGYEVDHTETVPWRRHDQ